MNDKWLLVLDNLKPVNKNETAKVGLNVHNYRIIAPSYWSFPWLIKIKAC